MNIPEDDQRIILEAVKIFAWCHLADSLNRQSVIYPGESDGQINAFRCTKFVWNSISIICA